ncbi:MAG: transcriptional repressor LexA [Acetobacteraceae bacterium]|nr:transcriptional repressor LexA [Acetobacteraceae bacterium]
MLTRKQYELLIYIDSYLKRTGYSPSFEEMKEALSLKSKSGIHRLISALEERNYLGRRHHRARALEVLRMPDNMAPRHETVLDVDDMDMDDADSPRFTPNVIKGDFTGRFQAVHTANDAAAVKLPLYGRIAAGLPIEALRDTTTMIDVPASLLGPGDHYALEVSGDSMVDAGILDGDTVLIRKGEVADNGQIVVALVDDTEVTLKRLRRRGNSTALEPCNQAYKSQILPADKVKVQGRLVGLLRRY